MKRTFRVSFEIEGSIIADDFPLNEDGIRYFLDTFTQAADAPMNSCDVKLKNIDIALLSEECEEE